MTGTICDAKNTEVAVGEHQCVTRETMRGRAGLVAARPRFAPLNPSRSSATPLRPCYGARWQGRTNSRTFDAFALRNEKTPGTPGFSNGEGGIRTPGTVSRTQHFQCCTIGRSATSPENSLRQHSAHQRQTDANTTQDNTSPVVVSRCLRNREGNQASTVAAAAAFSARRWSAAASRASTAATANSRRLN